MSRLIVRVDKSNKKPREIRDYTLVWNQAQAFVYHALIQHGIRGHLKIVPIRVCDLFDDHTCSVQLAGGNIIQFEYRCQDQKDGWLYNIAPDGQKYPPTLDMLQALGNRIMSERTADKKTVAATQSLSLPKLSTSDNSIIATPETPMMSNGAPNKSIQKIDLHETGDLLKSVVTAVDRIHSNRTALEEKTKKLANLREDFQRLKLEINGLEDSIGYLKIQIDDDQEGKQAETFMAQVAAFSKMTR